MEWISSGRLRDGLPSVLQALQTQNAQSGEFSLLFKTHPAPGVRVAMLDRMMKSQFDALPASAGLPLAVSLKEFVK